MDITFRFSEYGPFSGYNRTVKFHDVTLDDLEVIAAFSDVVTAFMYNDSGEDDESSGENNEYSGGDSEDEDDDNEDYLDDEEGVPEEGEPNDGD